MNDSKLRVIEIIMLGLLVLQLSIAAVGLAVAAHNAEKVARLQALHESP